MSGGPEVLTAEAVDAALVARGLSWQRQGDELVKTSTHQGFAGAMGFVNAVAELAEAADHHPDIDIRWNTVTLRLTTHSAGGLTERDLALAGEIDRVGAG